MAEKPAGTNSRSASPADRTDAEATCADVTTGEARYLMALLDLARPQHGDSPTQAALARRLGVSDPTALQMVRRMRTLGLVQPAALNLTPAGRSAALVLRARRNAALALMHDVLGIDEERADVEAAWLATAASPLLGRYLVAWHAHSG